MAALLSEDRTHYEFDQSVGCIIVGPSICGYKPHPGPAFMQHVRINAHKCGGFGGPEAAALLWRLLRGPSMIVMIPHCCAQYSQDQQELLTRAYDRRGVRFVFPDVGADAACAYAYGQLADSLVTLGLLRKVELLRSVA